MSVLWTRQVDLHGPLELIFVEVRRAQKQRDELALLELDPGHRHVLLEETRYAGDGRLPAQEFLDRFGQLPEEVQNLLYAVRIKLLAAGAGIESITTEHGQIVIRRFEGLPFDRQKPEPVIRDGVRVGHTQISLNLRRLGNKWKEMVGDILHKV